MFDFIGEIIKNAFAAIVAGIIALGGVFGNNNNLIQTPAPVIERRAIESSSTAKTTPTLQETSPQRSSGQAGQAGSSTATTEKKTSAPEKKESAAAKNPPALTVPSGPAGGQTSPAPSVVEQSKPSAPKDIQPVGMAATTTAIAAATTTASSSSNLNDNSLPPEIQPDSRSIVGILCYFNYGGERLLIRGSGVIINSQGDILTNKHIVALPKFLVTGDPDDVETMTDYALDRCEVGTLPSGYHLPTPDEIRGFNTTIRVPVLAYTAKPAYISGNSGLTSKEAFFADFAVLRVTGLTKDAPVFGVSSIPPSFPYAKLLPMQKYNLLGNDVVTYGFPGDVTTGQRDAFQTMTMTGSVGSLTRVEFGEKAYADVPLIIYTNLPITEGRSGSPLFWRGYVIGLTTFYIGENRTESGSVASDAIIKALKPTGYLGM